jgi:Flavin containing amine oxidoreductase
MDFRRRELLKLVGTSAAGVAAATIPREALASAPIIVRDVCVIGGGGAGAYAAVKLRDAGKSVVVVERSSRLGGHAETYRSSATSAPIDIGVQIFPDLPIVRDYFARYGVPLVSNGSSGGGTTVKVDFRTGKPVDAYTPTPAEQGQALFAYLQLVSTRYAFLDAKGYQLPPPGPVLDELLLPFGDFVQLHGLQALVPLFFQFEQGFGELLKTTSLYVLKNLSASVIGGILGGSFVAPPTGVSDLYEGVAAELGDDVLLSAKVAVALRCGNDRAYLLVNTDGGLRIVDCKKLLVTAPPVSSSFIGFDLDSTEAAVFRTFQPNYYYTAVLRLSGLPAGYTLSNAAPETSQNIAPMPGIFSIGPSRTPGLFNCKYGSTSAALDLQVKLDIKRSVERVKVPGLGKIRVEEFATFKSHSPYALMVKPSEIRSGFYARLQGLQGRNNTFYAGAAHETHSSAGIWSFVEALLPSLLA